MTRLHPSPAAFRERYGREGPMAVPWSMSAEGRPSTRRVATGSAST